MSRVNLNIDKLINPVVVKIISILIINSIVHNAIKFVSLVNKIKKVV